MSPLRHLLVLASVSAVLAFCGPKDRNKPQPKRKLRLTQRERRKRLKAKEADLRKAAEEREADERKTPEEREADELKGAEERERAAEKEKERERRLQKTEKKARLSEAAEDDDRHDQLQQTGAKVSSVILSADGPQDATPDEPQSGSSTADMTPQDEGPVPPTTSSQSHVSEHAATENTLPAESARPPAAPAAPFARVAPTQALKFVEIALRRLEVAARIVSKKAVTTGDAVSELPIVNDAAPTSGLGQASEPSTQSDLLDPTRSSGSSAETASLEQIPSGGDAPKGSAAPTDTLPHSTRWTVPSPRSTCSACLKKVGKAALGYVTGLGVGGALIAAGKCLSGSNGKTAAAAVSKQSSSGVLTAAAGLGAAGLVGAAATACYEKLQSHNFLAKSSGEAQAAPQETVEGTSEGAVQDSDSLPGGPREQTRLRKNGESSGRATGAKDFGGKSNAATKGWDAGPGAIVVTVCLVAAFLAAAYVLLGQSSESS